MAGGSLGLVAVLKEGLEVLAGGGRLGGQVGADAGFALDDVGRFVCVWATLGAALDEMGLHLEVVAAGVWGTPAGGEGRVTTWMRESRPVRRICCTR